MTAILVLHDVGDEHGGGPWRAALEAAGWDGPVLAPDLAGHGSGPRPVDGNYELVDAVWLALRVLQPVLEPPVVVGVGTNGWAAEMLALGGRAGALVLVDGVGGPWRSAEDWVDAQRRWIRAIADDPDALAPAPLGGMDPRLRHGVLPMTSRSTAEKAAAALPVPVLVLQSPRAPGALPGLPAQHIDECTPAAVAPAIVRWAGQD